MKRTLFASESSSMYLFGICAGSILSLFASLILTRVDVWLDGMSLYDWLGYALMQVAFVATVLVFCKVRRVNVGYACRLGAPKRLWQLALMPFIAIAAIMVFLPFANLWSEFLALIGFKGSGASMPRYSNVGIYFLSLIVMAVMPAVGEELLMRGGVFRGLSSKGLWFGVLISATLFSLMHANPLQTVHQFGLGVVLALVAVLTDSLWACCIVHFVNNFASITMAAYLPEIDALYFKLGYFNWLTGAASVLVGLFALVALLYAVYRLGDGARNFRVTSGGIEYDEFTIYAIDDNKKQNPVSQFFAFFKSLFTRSGWRRLTLTLTRSNGIEIRSEQKLYGVYIALGLVAVYWLYAFIRGLV